MIKNDSSLIKPFFGTVKAKEAGARLDIWLVDKLKISRKRVKRLIDDNFIKINSKQVSIAKWMLETGDEVRVVPTKTPRVSVIHEDSDLLIIDKPPNLLSVPLEGSQKPSAYDAVKEYLMRKYADSKGVFVKPLHRLDAGTSGLLMFAKSKRGLKAMDLFRNHTIDRKYKAIVTGRIEDLNGEIKLSLKKGKFGEGRMTKAGEGKSAITKFTVAERYKNATLLDLSVRTGRTHQIRAHLSIIGYPLVGDDVYGKKDGFRRPALHAERLIFKHPSSGRKLDLKSPIPKDMEKLINKLRDGCLRP